MESASNKPPKAALPLLAVLALAVLAAPLSWPQSAGQPAAAPPAPGDEGPLVTEGPPADLAIIYTGGVVGYVEPCG